ncbi:MAG: acyltransferase [Planctomycetes bacterium]|nr:acyltransferase [Planctomycetota bacterium]
MNPTQHRILAIDGLRAIAVLAVLVYHLFAPALPGGFVGVDVFFVISGYVVCGSLLKADARAGFLDFATGFYARRLLRIYPALVVMLLVVGVLKRMFVPVSFLAGTSAHTGFYAFFGLSNIQLIMKTEGYFAPTAEFNPFTHTWSLAVEEQFYFLFPPILYAYLRSGRGAAWLLAALGGGSLAYAAFETTARPDWAYYLLPSRFWELAIGAIVCLCHRRNRLLARTPSQAAGFVVAGLLCIAASLALTQAAWFPFPWAISPVVGSALYIIGVAGQTDCLPARLLSSRAVVYVGRISYSLYLWHWPVIVLMRWTCGIESPSQMLVATLLSFALGSLSYHLIEKTFQFSSATIERAHFGKLPAHAVVVIVSLLVIVGASGLYFGAHRSASLPQSITTREISKTDWQLSAQDITASQLCPGEPGKPWNGRRLFVVGDSHAESYAEVVSLLRRHQGVDVYLSGLGGARIGSLVSSQTASDRSRQVGILADIRRWSRPGDVIFLASFRVLRFGTQWASLPLDEVLKQRDSAAAEAERQLAVQEGVELIRQLQPLGLVVLIDAPKPTFAAPPFRCSDWFNQMNPIGRPGFVMDREFLLTHRAQAMRSIAAVQQACPAVRVWDPFPLLCRGQECSAFDGDKPLFFDNDHLSGHGNRVLYPALVDLLGEIWSVASE